MICRGRCSSSSRMTGLATYSTLHTANDRGRTLFVLTFSTRYVHSFSNHTNANAGAPSGPPAICRSMQRFSQNSLCRFAANIVQWLRKALLIPAHKKRIQRIAHHQADGIYPGEAQPRGCAAHRGVGQQLQHQRVGQVQTHATSPHKFHCLIELLNFRQANALRVLLGK